MSEERDARIANALKLRDMGVQKILRMRRQSPRQFRACARSWKRIGRGEQPAIMTGVRADHSKSASGSAKTDQRNAQKIH